MGYNKKQLFEIAKDLIKTKRIIFINELISFMPCVKSTFYLHFPKESDKYKELEELMMHNKIEIKASMRAKWYKSNSPVLQLGLYKLLATPEEIKALSMQHTDITTDGEKLPETKEKTVIMFTQGAKADENKAE